MVRTKGGRGREGRGRGEQRGWGNVLVGQRDRGHWHRLVITVCGDGHWRRLVIIIPFRSALTSFVAVHHALLSLVRSCPGCRSVSCVCVSIRGLWWSCLVFVGAGRRLCFVLSFARCGVICVMSCRLRGSFVFVMRSWQLLLFLDGWVRVSEWASCDVTSG